MDTQEYSYVVILAQWIVANQLSFIELLFMLVNYPLI